MSLSLFLSLSLSLPPPPFPYRIARPDTSTLIYSVLPCRRASCLAAFSHQKVLSFRGCPVSHHLALSPSPSLWRPRASPSMPRGHTRSTASRCCRPRWRLGPTCWSATSATAASRRLMQVSSLGLAPLNTGCTARRWRGELLRGVMGRRRADTSKTPRRGDCRPSTSALDLSPLSLSPQPQRSQRDTLATTRSRHRSSFHARANPPVSLHITLRAAKGRQSSRQEPASAARQAVLCHPPSTTSDLSLGMLLEALAACEKKGAAVGLKLDFKDVAAVAPSIRALQRAGFDPCTTPLWLNADVLNGPGAVVSAAETTAPLALSNHAPRSPCRRRLLQAARRRRLTQTPLCKRAPPPFPTPCCPSGTLRASCRGLQRTPTQMPWWRRWALCVCWRLGLLGAWLGAFADTPDLRHRSR